MKTINGITLTGKKAKRLSDGKIFEIIIPSMELGYFKSLVYLKECGYDINKYIENLIVELNPHRFKTLTTQEISDEFIINTPYDEAVKLQDDEGYVYCEGFGKIHIDNWRIKGEQDMKKLICENCKSIHEEGSKRCYCGSTTLSPTHPSNKTDREKAMEWWNNLSMLKKHGLALTYYKRKPDSLTGREIEHIWNMEFVWKKSERKSDGKLWGDDGERLYTKEDVEFLIMQSHIARNKMTDPYNQIPEWIENNL
jgi:hypothetical protein